MARNKLLVLPVADATTAFGEDLPKGQLILNESTGQLFRLTDSAGSGDTLGTASKDDAGESNTASNVGAGEGEVFKTKTGVDLEFKTIKAGANITVFNDTDVISISGSGGDGGSSFDSLADGGGTQSTLQGDISNNLASGTYAIAEGKLTTAYGNYSHTEGQSTTATGKSSHAEGADGLASGLYAHSEGFSVRATNYASHAEGQFTEATNVGAHSEGASTTASGLRSHAEGEYTTASGNNSHAEGSYTAATNTGAHAEGKSYYSGFILASGPGSHAEGYAYYTSRIRATNKGAHAEGYATIGQYILASGKGAHAEGTDTTAAGSYSHVGGQDARDGGFANCMVWSDGSAAEAATASKQYRVRASGGVFLNLPVVGTGASGTLWNDTGTVKVVP